MAESSEDCHRQGIYFSPIVVVSLGGFHAVAVREVKKLASALAKEEEEGTVRQCLDMVISARLDEKLSRQCLTRLSLLLENTNC